MEKSYLSDEFLKEEIRCDYLISQKEKKIWAVELDLLSKLLEVCKKYDIKVCAFAGTLLGAIRHKGFIPWDDDIDVCLLKEDYEKLLSVTEAEFQEPYFFQTAKTDKRFHIGYARLRNSNTTGFITYNNDINYNNGIFIDIFILNGYIDNKLKLWYQVFRLRFIEKFIHTYYTDIYTKTGIKKYLMAIIKWFENRIISYNTLIDIYYRIQTLYDCKSDRVTLMTHNSWFMKRYWCMKEDLKEIIWVPFESVTIPIPRNYDQILKNSYGDYMSFPPIEKRGKWHDNVIIFDPYTPYIEFIKKLYENKYNI